MSRAVFFDADGTICDLKEGISVSTRESLPVLRKNGHTAWLCTGRCRAMIPEELAAGFDGIVAACGTYLEYQGKTLFNHELSCAEALRSVQVLRKYRMIPVLEGAEAMYYDLDEYTTRIDSYCGLITQQLGPKRKPIAGNENRLRINKISAKRTPASDEERACRELNDLYDYIVHGEGMARTTIEMVPKGYSKATGIAAVCRIFGIPWEDTVVFGDSNNDLSMFQYAAVKVAMGNATKELRTLADYVTDTMFEDGIQHGLKHLGLIE